MLFCFVCLQSLYVLESRMVLLTVHSNIVRNKMVKISRFIPLSLFYLSVRLFSLFFSFFLSIYLSVWPSVSLCTYICLFSVLSLIFVLLSFHSAFMLCKTRCCHCHYLPVRSSMCFAVSTGKTKACVFAIGKSTAIICTFFVFFSWNSTVISVQPTNNQFSQSIQLLPQVHLIVM